MGPNAHRHRLRSNGHKSSQSQELCRKFGVNLAIFQNSGVIFFLLFDHDFSLILQNGVNGRLHVHILAYPGWAN